MKYVAVGFLTLSVMLMLTSNILPLHILGGLLGIIGGYVLGGIRK